MIKKLIITGILISLCAQVPAFAGKKAKSTRDVIHRNANKPLKKRNRVMYTESTKKTTSNMLQPLLCVGFGAFCGLCFSCLNEDISPFPEFRAKDAASTVVMCSCAGGVGSICLDTFCSCKKKKNK